MRSLNRVPGGLVVSDPAHRPQEQPSATDRIALRFIHDRRDLPFVKLMAVLTLTVIPTAVVLFVPGGFRWWLGVAHNDGYHIGHHLKPTRHWTEMPHDFRRHIRTYQPEGAIFFTGIDFFGVWLLLMFKRSDRLAAHVVTLGGARAATAEIVALLRSRTGWTSTTA